MDWQERQRYSVREILADTDRLVAPRRSISGQTVERWIVALVMFFGTIFFGTIPVLTSIPLPSMPIAKIEVPLMAASHSIKIPAIPGREGQILVATGAESAGITPTAWVSGTNCTGGPEGAPCVDITPVHYYGQSHAMSSGGAENHIGCSQSSATCTP